MDDNWNTAQWTVCGICVGLVLLKCIVSLKKCVKQRRLLRDGYRRCDIVSQQLYCCYKANGLLMCVFGFEVCSDAMTPTHLKDMARELMRSFINFRSQTYQIDGVWYFREEFDPETENMDKYVTVIPLDLDTDNDGPTGFSPSAQDDDVEINEKILQRALRWMNENRAFNVDMMEWQRPNFDILYFHFRSLGKCVIVFRIDHGLGDGMLMSAIIGLFHHKMYSDSVSSDIQNSPWSKLLKMQPLMESLCDGVSPSLSRPSSCDRIRSGLYRLCHVPVACCQIIQQWPPPQMPQCAFWGEFKNHHKMAIGCPISINDFKSVAHSHGESVTVNDLFMTISHGALRRYAEKMKCSEFASDQFDGTVGHMVPINRRILTPHELREYAENGLSSNKIVNGGLLANLKTSNVHDVKEAFHSCKYGAGADILYSLGKTMSPKALDDLSQAEKLKEGFVLASSNIRGPKRLLPTPTRTGTATQQSGGGFVQILFGMGTGPMLHNFTLMSYGESLRIGIVSNCGNIEDPNTLMQCFMDEWRQYEAQSEIQRDAHLGLRTVVAKCTEEV